MNAVLKSIGLLITITGVIGIIGCNSGSNPYSTPSANNSGNNTTTSPNTVVLYNMSFGPASLTVARGTTVTWKNDDGIVHTATSDTGAWDSGNISAGGTKSVTFNTAGTFPYHCTIHPTMTGTIIVQ